MAKKNIRYVCSNCGSVSSTWAGRCHVCGEWNTIEEELLVDEQTIAKSGTALRPKTIESAIKETSKRQRLPSGMHEVDVVLGGGFVAGSVTLIGGQPGIGKSTLLLQLAHELSAKNNVLYVSGEESIEQLVLRAQRLSVDSKKLNLVTSTSADDIASTISQAHYDLVIVDSIQTITVEQLHSAPGSVNQITNSSHLLIAAAKNSRTALILVGHVTKEGSLAGPKVLEHMVDVVLQLEGDRYGGFKLLRGIKNRYGSTNETGIFEMTDKGMQPVANPSKALLAERQNTDGSVVLATMEGTRPLLVEVQALVNRSGFGYPKRTASGIDINRLNLLIAMLERRTNLHLADQDVYVNVVGGIKITEPAADLAVCMAIASATRGLALKQNVVVFGEVGLSGEVRHVPFVEKRLEEAKKLGFDGAIGPAGSKSSQLRTVKSINFALTEFLKK